MAKPIAVVQVTKVDVKEKRGVSRDKGLPYLIREQTVWIDLGDEHPEKMIIRLEDEAPPYQPGRYVITDECLYLDKYKQLSIARVTLKSVPASGVKSAAVG